MNRSLSGCCRICGGALDASPMSEGYQKCFYQKHVNEKVPPAIGRIEIEEEDKRDTYMLAESPEALLGLVQMGVLEVHTWGATKDRLERPDRLTFDLDPDPSVPWKQVIEAAYLTKTLLEELGLVCFLKTTGGKGLHIVTPIQRTQGWEEVKTFAKMVADHLVTTIPQRFTPTCRNACGREKSSSITFGTRAARRLSPPTRRGPSPVLRSRCRSHGTSCRKSCLRTISPS